MTKGVEMTKDEKTKLLCNMASNLHAGKLARASTAESGIEMQRSVEDAIFIFKEISKRTVADSENKTVRNLSDKNN